MQKIKSLFKRDYAGNGLVYNEIVEGCEWVVAGEGRATMKYDGTCCLVRDGKLYKRYDRKLSKSARRRNRVDKTFVLTVSDFKPAPDGWEAAEPEPNKHTGHWPGWVLVDFDLPENKWHTEGWDNFQQAVSLGYVSTGTFELVGPKIQSNPYNLDSHNLWRHGAGFAFDIPRTFDKLDTFFAVHEMEGIVWHHPDGRMAKIKRRDFGYPWPCNGEAR